MHAEVVHEEFGLAPDNFCDSRRRTPDSGGAVLEEGVTRGPQQADSGGVGRGGGAGVGLGGAATTKHVRQEVHG